MPKTLEKLKSVGFKIKFCPMGGTNVVTTKIFASIPISNEIISNLIAIRSKKDNAGNCLYTKSGMHTKNDQNSIDYSNICIGFEKEIFECIFNGNKNTADLKTQLKKSITDIMKKSIDENVKAKIKLKSIDTDVTLWENFAETIYDDLVGKVFSAKISYGNTKPESPDNPLDLLDSDRYYVERL